MRKKMDVYFKTVLVGSLTQDTHGQLGFEYEPGWLSDPTAIPLSHSLPLRKDPFFGKECRGFFGGLLPEEENRKLIAKNLGISAQNDFSMLEQIGGECAGALTFIPSGMPLIRCEGRYRKLKSQELTEILQVLPRRPLLAGEEGVRLSLAGAQNKIAVCVQEGEIYAAWKKAGSAY